MSTSLDTIVNVVIAQATAAVPQPSFSIPLVVGPNAPRTLTYYTDPDSMLSDGFTSSDVEYKYVQKIFSQALSPEGCYVGLRTTAVKQIVTLAVSTLTEGHVYTVTIDGTPVTYTALGGGTKADTLDGLLDEMESLIDPAVCTGVVSGTGDSALLTLTAVTKGVGVAYTAIDSLLTYTQTLASHGIADDLALIANDPLGNGWYGLALCSNVAEDIIQAAAWIETKKKIFIAVSADGAVDTAATSDVASVLQSKSYKRTALVYSPASAALGVDAGWLGGQLPQIPGSSTWKFKNIVGISPDTFTATSRTRLIGAAGSSFGKGVNIYEEVGGVAITEEGWMAGGQYIDVTVGVDYLESRIQNRIYTVLTQAAKVPYTDKGVAMVESEVRGALAEVSDAPGGTGFLDQTTIEVTVKKVADIPVASRASRILPANSIKFTARLAGALHFVVISGTVTV